MTDLSQPEESPVRGQPPVPNGLVPPPAPQPNWGEPPSVPPSTAQYPPQYGQVPVPPPPPQPPQPPPPQHGQVPIPQPPPPPPPPPAWGAAPYQPQPQPQYPGQYQLGQFAPSGPAPAPAPAPAKKKTGLIVAIVGALVVALGVAAYFFFFSTGPLTPAQFDTLVDSTIQKELNSLPSVSENLEFATKKGSLSQSQANCTAQIPHLSGGAISASLEAVGGPIGFWHMNVGFILYGTHEAAIGMAETLGISGCWDVDRDLHVVTKSGVTIYTTTGGGDIQYRMAVYRNVAVWTIDSEDLSLTMVTGLSDFADFAAGPFKAAVDKAAR